MYVCRLSLSTIYLQVVQRSLSGGFLTEDAALLNANACSMLDVFVTKLYRQHALGESRPNESHTTQGDQEEYYPRHPHCELWELTYTPHTFTFTFTKRRC